MQWNEDDLQLPIDKPAPLLSLEKLSDSQLNAMTDVEIDERMDEAAFASAHKYCNKVPQGNYDECVAVVSILLNTSGASVGGKVGAKMVASSESLACQACRRMFPPEAIEY